MFPLRPIQLFASVCSLSSRVTSFYCSLSLIVSLTLFIPYQEPPFTLFSSLFHHHHYHKSDTVFIFAWVKPSRTNTTVCSHDPSPGFIIVETLVDQLTLRCTTTNTVPYIKIRTAIFLFEATYPYIWKLCLAFLHKLRGLGTKRKVGRK
jgi:hypothetical protein